MNAITVDITFSDMLLEVLLRAKTFDKAISLPLMFNIGNHYEIENLSIYDFIYDSYEVKSDLKLKMNNFKKEIKKHKKFRIWYSQSSPEYCGMLYLIHLLNEVKSCDISLINCTQTYRSGNSTVFYTSTKEISHENLSFFVQKQIPLDSDFKEKFLEEFHKYFCHRIRIVENNKINVISESECKNQFMTVLKKEKQRISFAITDAMNETLLDENTAIYAMNLLAKENIIKISGDYVYK